jgi:hypothetical protein
MVLPRVSEAIKSEIMDKGTTGKMTAYTPYSCPSQSSNRIKSIKNLKMH